MKIFKYLTNWNTKRGPRGLLVQLPSDASFSHSSPIITPIHHTYVNTCIYTNMHICVFTTDVFRHILYIYTHTHTYKPIWVVTQPLLKYFQWLARNSLITILMVAYRKGYLINTIYNCFGFFLSSSTKELLHSSAPSHFPMTILIKTINDFIMLLMYPFAGLIQNQTWKKNGMKI